MNNELSFQGKTVVITGAGAGIGKTTALEFARRGAKLVVNAKSLENARATALEAEAFGNGAIFVDGDASDEAVAKMAIESAVSRFGSVDILVNCAGVVPQGSVVDTSPEEWDEVMRVNVKSVYLMSRLAIAQMRKQSTGGTIINVASVIATKGFPNRALYAASKGAVASLTKAMAADHIKENIRINAISPGTVLSPSLEQRINNTPDPVAEKKMYESRQPLGRLGATSEIALGILFLASAENGFMTGANLIIDGGVSI